MYQKGLISIGNIEDSTQKYASIHGAYLPHSCSEWVIGGPEEIRAMIGDLVRALGQIEIQNGSANKI